MPLHPAYPGDGWTQSIKPFFGRFLLPLYHNMASRNSRQAFRKSTPTLSFDSLQKDIQFLLMNDMLQIRNHELGDILGLLRSLFPKYLVYVNQK